MRPLLIGLITAIIGWAALGAESAIEDTPPPLMQLSPQELRNVEVTSVSRKEELLLNAPAAIHVIDNEDIARSGANFIAETLRMAPGMDVARINANKWAVSARGFNSRFANKQLVLMDGRTLYTPVFSGLYWDTVDTFLEDIDRIEVVRGPGGTQWGANAVNGVINIITKDARETQGTIVTGGFGNEEQGFGGIRYGGMLSPDFHYRVYAKAFNHEDFDQGGGVEGADEWWQQREGFRTDWAPEEARQLTVQGDFYYGRSGDRFLLAYPTAPFIRPTRENAKVVGWNLLSRWTQTLSEKSDYSAQFYYDRNHRENAILNAKLDTLDLDFQNRLQLGERNEFLWGGGYRLLLQDLEGSYTATYTPGWREDQLYSAFAQDEFEAVTDKLWLTLGTKVEHNDLSDWEVQPSARLTFKPAENQTIWAAVSRAVRTPSVFEETLTGRVALNPAVVALVSPNPDFRSEELIALEAGYRIQATPEVFVSIAIFYHVYDELRTSEQGTIIPGPPITVPLTYGNQFKGETYGLEFGPNWQVTDYWRLSAGYSLLQMDLEPDGFTRDLGGRGIEGQSPQHQAHVRSFLDLPHNVQLDTAFYYVDALPNLNVGSYVRWDTRVGWSPTRNLNLAIVVQNILDPRRREFGTSTLITPTEVERSVYGKITWRF